MTDQLLRAALIGCGRMGAHTSLRVRRTVPRGWLPLSHADAIDAVAGLELVGVCDTDEVRAHETAALHPSATAFGDHENMILSLRPDIVTVATRAGPRPEIVRFAACNGVGGIHAEKPFGRSLHESERALESVQSHDVKMTYGTTRRFMEAYRHARDLLAEGVVGDLVEIAVEHGRTSLLWNHPHSVDLLIYFAGSTSVDYVQADCHIDPSDVGPEGVDADPVVEHAYIRFSNGVGGTITSASGMNTRLVGSRGTIVVAADGSRIETHGPGTAEEGPYHFLRSTRDVLPARSGTEQAFIELAGAVRGGSATGIGVDEIRVAQRVLFAMVLSALRGGVPVGTEEVRPEFIVTGRTGDLYA